MADIQGSSYQLLRDELISRQKKNEAYSLRSFAQTIGVSPSYLSLLFHGRRQLSQDKAVSIARKLQWNQSRQKYFLTLVEFENTKVAKDKQMLLEELQKWARASKQVPSLAVDQFAMISEWQHSAILAILTLPNFVGRIKNIAERLNISEADAESCLQRLQRLNLVSQDEQGLWQTTHEELHVIPEVASNAVRSYHKEVIRKAMVAIDTQESAERDFSNFILTVDGKKMGEAKKRIFAFQQEMAQLLEGKTPSKLYQLSIQLFRVDQDEKGKLHEQ
ncbi:TIGR02147 family protein [Bdellovibrio sp. HCB337]|uniref:TIGR02147 family protein n=1 Tax=Bdellovibrio sp. HCB337 TaxID=3394358 RepID=UPI0039A60959